MRIRWNKLISFRQSERPPRGGLSEIRSGVSIRQLRQREEMRFYKAAKPVMQFELSLPITRFERTGDAIRPRLHGRRCPRSARSGARPAHPFRAKHEDATHYNRRRISQGSAAGALR